MGWPNSKLSDSKPRARASDQRDARLLVDHDGDNGLARSTKFETLAELDQAFHDLNEEYSQWLEP